MRDQDLLLDRPKAEFGSGVIGVCDICGVRQAVIVLARERFKLCVIDFLNKSWVGSKQTPGVPLPAYASERVWFETDAVAAGRAPAILLTPTKVVKHPIVLLTPDHFGLTTTVLDAAIRFAREGFQVILPDVGRTSGIGPGQQLALPAGRLSGGVALSGPTAERWARLFRDALRHARELEMVDPDRLGVFGHGYGAALAMAVAAREPRLSALVLAAPVPVKPPEYSALLTAPSLVVAGGSDAIARRALSQLQAPAARPGAPMEIAEFPGAGRFFLARDMRGYAVGPAESAWSRIVEFLHGRLLPAPVRPPPPPIRSVPPTIPPAEPTPPRAGSTA